MPNVNLNKSTTMSLGLAIVIGGVVAWASHVDAQVQTNTQNIERNYNQTMQTINELNQKLTTTNSNLVTTNNSVLILNQLLRAKE